jgi:hypothetical protein
MLSIILMVVAGVVLYAIHAYVIFWVVYAVWVLGTLGAHAAEQMRR